MGTQRSSKRSSIIKGSILSAFLIAVVVVWLTLPVPTVDQIRDAVAGAGWWGGVVFVVGYGVASLVPIPKSVVSIAAGLVFGFWLGVVLVTAASIIGATLAFLIGRGLGRDLVDRLFGAQLTHIDEKLSENGVRAVIVLRLIPVLPFTALNYSAGLTRVRRRDYALGTLIGMLPGTAVFVAIGAFGFSLGWPFFITAGCLAVVAGIVWLLVHRHRSKESDRDEGGVHERRARAAA